MDDLDRLERLNRLRESGGLTAEEFEAQKARIFAEQAARSAPPPGPPMPPVPPSPPIPPEPARPDLPRSEPVRPEPAKIVWAPPVAEREHPMPVRDTAPSPVPWPWIVGAIALLVLVIAGAVWVGRDAIGNDAAITNESGLANATAPFPLPSASPSAVAIPVVTVQQNQLFADGQPVQPAVRGNNGLAIVRTVTAGDHTLYVVQDTGGSACPATFRIADASAAGVTVSDGFGTCSDVIRITEQPDGVSLSMPAFAGPDASSAERAAIGSERHLFRYTGGRVRETVTGHRTVVRPPAPAPDDDDDYAPERDEQPAEIDKQPSDG